MFMLSITWEPDVLLIQEPRFVTAKRTQAQGGHTLPAGHNSPHFTDKLMLNESLDDDSSSSAWQKHAGFLIIVNCRNRRALESSTFVGNLHSRRFLECSANVPQTVSLCSFARKHCGRLSGWARRAPVVCVWPNRLPLLCAAPPLGLSEKSVEEIVAKQAVLGWSAALCPITHCFGPELEMKLNTEQEEKRLLREQVHQMEVEAHTHTHTLKHTHTHIYTKSHLNIQYWRGLCCPGDNGTCVVRGNSTEGSTAWWLHSSAEGLQRSLGCRWRNLEGDDWEERPCFVIGLLRCVCINKTCRGGNLKTSWWTPGVTKAITQKKELVSARLTQGSPENVERDRRDQSEELSSGALEWRRLPTWPGST